MITEKPDLDQNFKSTDSFAVLIKKSKRWWLSIVLLNLTAALCGCDEQLLPASFRALEVELGFYPSLLSLITLAQTITLALSCPVWGYLADKYSHKDVMAVGVFSWGVFTLMLAFTYALWQIFSLRVLNGIFLGSVAPTSQTILANMIPAASRSVQFGFIQTCTSAGRIVGGIVTTSVSQLTFMGFSGWRWTFFFVGLVSIFLGVFILIFHDMLTRSASMSTSYKELHSVHSQTVSKGHKKSFFQFFGFVLRNSISKPTIILLALEGILGTISWSALSFFSLYLQYCELSDARTGIAASALLLGSMICGPLGGMMADRLHVRFPNHTRPFIGQISIISRVPLVYLIFMFIPKHAESFWYFTGASFLLGLLAFAGAVVNRPILSEITTPDHRGTTFAIVVAVETAIGSIIGTGGVGLVIEHIFHYERTALPISELTEEVRLNNATALGKAIFALTAIPWIFSALIFTSLHFTYPRDRKQLDRELRTCYMDIDNVDFILENTVQNPLGSLY